MGCGASKASAGAAATPAAVAAPAAPASPAAAAPAATAPVEDLHSLVSKAAAEGVPAVLALLASRSTEADVNWWCFDALSSLSAGNEEARTQIREQGGIQAILEGMRLFQWDENCVSKGAMVLGILGASFSEELGRLGGVDAILTGMRTCSTSYQALNAGTRSLLILASNCAANLERAAVLGASKVLKEALESNPEDGQLQWRGQTLLTKLAEAEEKLAASANGAGSAAELVAPTSPWSKPADPRASMAVAAAAPVPGTTGVSAQVAEAYRTGGLKGTMDFMRANPDSIDVARWCCDVVATGIDGKEENRKIVADAGGLDLITAAMGKGVWEEEFLLWAFRALLVMAPGYPLEIGANGGIKNIVNAMYHNKTVHDLQVAGVKLLSLLTLEPAGTNATLAREANAVRIVKEVVAAHSDDGQLAYRGINLLERLERGCTAEMPKLSLIRSASMRAEEMAGFSASFRRVHSIRSMGGSSLSAAITASGLNSASGSMATYPGSGSNIFTPRADAIKEVDEMAVAVEDDSDEEEGGSRRNSTANTNAAAVAAAIKAAAEPEAASTGAGAMPPAPAVVEEAVVFVKEEAATAAAAAGSTEGAVAAAASDADVTSPSKSSGVLMRGAQGKVVTLEDATAGLDVDAL